MAKHGDYHREPQGPALHSHFGVVHDHPAGEQPHSHGRQKHRLRHAMLVVGGLIVLIIIVAVAAYYGSGPS